MTNQQAPSESDWEKEWLNYKVDDYGKWKIDRQVAIEFIRKVRAEAVEEDRKRILEALPKEVRHFFPENRDASTGFATAIREVVYLVKKKI